MKNLYLAIFAFCTVTCAQSQTTYTWIGPNNGSWATPGNWSPTRNSPANNDIIRFNGNITRNITSVPSQTIGRLQVIGDAQITLNASTSNRTLTVGNMTGDDLIVNASSSLTIGSGTNFILYLTNNATADISGTLTISAGRTYATNTSGTVTTVKATGVIENRGTVNSTNAARLIFQPNATYIHDQNGGTIPTATWDVNSTSEITGIDDNAPSGLNQNFGNFTWDCPDQDGSISLDGDLTSVAGDLTIHRSDKRRIYLAEDDNSTYTLNIGGDLIIDNDSWLVITNGDNITATVNVDGDFSMSANDEDASILDFHYATGTGTSLNKIILNIAGNYTQSGGRVDLCYGTSNVNNFTELRLGGNFSLTGNGRLITTTEDNNVTNGTVTFNKAGTQTFTATTPGNITYTNFIVASGSTLQLNSSISLSSNTTGVWGGKFTVNSGGTLDAGTNQVVSSSGIFGGSNNEFRLNAGGKIITSHNNGLENALFGGTISTALDTRTYSSDADYEFGGNNTGFFTTSPAASTARDIVINNPTGNVTLSQSMNVTRDLTLLDGELNTSTLTLITVNDNATASGYSNQSFVNGPIRKRGNDNFTFPTGRSGAGLVPIRLASLSTSSDFTATYQRSSAWTLGLITAVGLARVSFCEYWNLTRTGAATANVTMYWGPQSNCNAAAYVDDLASIVVSRFNSTSWDGFGRTGGTTGTIANGTVTWNNVNVFNSFALGTTSNIGNPLPITLDNVRAFEKNNGVEVQWSNLTEKDVYDYTVEHSVNGVDFTAVNYHQPKNNQGDKADYTSLDPSPVRGVNYYRIKVRETTGRSIYSKILRVDIGSHKPAISLYPNPVRDRQLNIALSGMKQGTITLSIFNYSGQSVYNKTIQAQGSTVTQSIQLPSSIAPGLYTVLVSGQDYTDKQTFIVQ